MIIYLICGIVQGISEFLPISSSGHLYLVSNILKFNASDKLAFFVWLHFATLFAVLVFFYKDILAVLRNKTILINIIITTVTTSIVAIVIKKIVGSYFDNHYLIACGFIATTMFLLLNKVRMGGKMSMDGYTLKEALILGIIQGIAVVPGISRSGVTITTLMRRGFDSGVSFRLSFLVSIPVILAAFIYESRGIQGTFSTMYIWGFISAFISGLIALKVLKNIISRKHLYYFGYYCIFMIVISIII